MNKTWIQKYLQYQLYLLIFFIVVLFSSSVSAQSKKVEKDYTQILETVKARMDLDDETFEKVSEIVLKYNEQKKEILSKELKDNKNKEALIKNMMSSQRTELKDILTIKKAIEFQKILKEEERNYKSKQKLNDEERLAMAQEIGAYYSTSVQPVVAKKRLDLDALISEKDKKELSHIRDQAQALASSLKEKKKECNEIPHKDRAAKKKCMVEYKSINKQIKPHKAQSDVLIARIQENPNAKAIFTDLNTLEKKWSTDITNILIKHFGVAIEDTATLPVGPNYYLKTSKPLNFVLLDTDQINRDALEESTNNIAKTEILNVNLYEGFANLNYKVGTDGLVKIGLYDIDGKLLKVLLEEPKNIGQHNLKIDLKDTNSGVLICKIEDGTDQAISKFVWLK